jgi:hypothetical protein
MQQYLQSPIQSIQQRKGKTGFRPAERFDGAVQV